MFLSIKSVLYKILEKLLNNFVFKKIKRIFVKTKKYSKQLCNFGYILKNDQ